MEEKICRGSGKRLGTCTEVLGEKNSTGYCSRCYAMELYYKKHPKKNGGGVAKAPKAPKEFRLKVPGGGDPLPDPSPGVQIGCGEQTNERVISIQLGESKVQRLLNLLLQ